MTDLNPIITDEMIERAAQALHDHRSMECRALHEVGQPLRDSVYDNERRADARVTLEAAASLIAAQALRKEARNFRGTTGLIARAMELETGVTPSHAAADAELLREIVIEEYRHD